MLHSTTLSFLLLIVSLCYSVRSKELVFQFLWCIYSSLDRTLVHHRIAHFYQLTRLEWIFFFSRTQCISWSRNRKYKFYNHESNTLTTKPHASKFHGKNKYQLTEKNSNGTHVINSNLHVMPQHGHCFNNWNKWEVLISIKLE